MKRGAKLYGFILGALVISGCGGGDSGGGLDEYAGRNIVNKLSPQKSGEVQNYLFYGETNSKVLGGLQNIRVIDPLNPDGVIVKNDDITDVRYPVVTTGCDFNATDMSYKNLHFEKLHYVSNGTPFVVSLKKGDEPLAKKASFEQNLSSVSYTEIVYKGVKQYLVAENAKKRTLLITPEMTGTDAAVPFGNRKLLTVTYPFYGARIDGYLVYDNDTSKVQKCTTDMLVCSDIFKAGSRDFKGDIAGTTYAIFENHGKIYRVNKADKTVDEISLEGRKIASGHGTTAFLGGSFYFIADDFNLYRVDLLSKEIIKITKEPDERLERVRGFTADWVIFGSDTVLMASKKDATTKEPVILVETTKTKGYKYITNFGVGDDYLFVTYSVDKDTGNTTYQACIFKNGDIECRPDSFWASIVASKEGKVNFESSYIYTPYAYVRVDDTDNYGGGTLKAIDPKHPMQDGITMGRVANYNFQTFLSNSRYLDKNVDSNGSIILFAKNDATFHVDAFYMNLLKENSLKQLTDTDPFPGVISGKNHCHGRHCMICHNLAGGKIYKDLNGTKTAYGYRIRLDFEDGTNVLMDVAKGKGENFSMDLKKIKGKFKANVIDINGTVINRSKDFEHRGVENANCNYCHARGGKYREDAPGVIALENVKEDEAGN